VFRLVLGNGGGAIRCVRSRVSSQQRPQQDGCEVASLLFGLPGRGRFLSRIRILFLFLVLDFFFLQVGALLEAVGIQVPRSRGGGLMGGRTAPRGETGGGGLDGSARPGRPRLDRFRRLGGIALGGRINLAGALGLPGDPGLDGATGAGNRIDRLLALVFAHDSAPRIHPSMPRWRVSLQAWITRQDMALSGSGKSRSTPNRSSSSSASASARSEQHA